jgi:hypothetical protein
MPRERGGVGYLAGWSPAAAPIDELIEFDLRQSMRNGGGPACLRLRVALTDDEAQAMHQGVIMTEDLYARWCPGSSATTATTSSRRTWPTRSWRSNAWPRWKIWNAFLACRGCTTWR